MISLLVLNSRILNGIKVNLRPHKYSLQTYFFKWASASENYENIGCLSKLLFRARNLRHRTTMTRTATITPATTTTAGTLLVPLSEEKTCFRWFRWNYVRVEKQQMNNTGKRSQLISNWLLSPSKGEYRIVNWTLTKTPSPKIFMGLTLWQRSAFKCISKLFKL